MSEVDWSSDEMINVRIDLIAEDIVMRVFNKSMQFYAFSPEVAEVLEGLGSTSMGDNRVCELCLEREGKVWKPGAFMPNFPFHIGCRCSLDIVLRSFP